MPAYVRICHAVPDTEIRSCIARGARSVEEVVHHIDYIETNLELVDRLGDQLHLGSWWATRRRAPGECGSPPLGVRRWGIEDMFES